jgi:hypothetical protein
VPRSPALSLTAMILLSTLPGLPGSPARAQEAAASVEGRWKGEVLRSKPFGFRPVTIDIAPCGGAVCGRLVEANGFCGAVILRLSPASSGRLKGDLILPEGTFDAQVFREEEFLTLEVFVREEAMTRFTRVMPASSSFSPAGPASCHEGVS